MRRHREEAGLLHVQGLLRRHGVEGKEACRPEVDITEEGIDSVLHRRRAFHHSGQLAEVKLLDFDGGSILVKKRIQNCRAHNTRGPCKTLERPIQEGFRGSWESNISWRSHFGFIIIRAIDDFGRRCVEIVGPIHEVIRWPVAAIELIERRGAAACCDREVGNLQGPILGWVGRSIIEVVGLGIVPHQVGEVEGVERLRPTSCVDHIDHPATSRSSGASGACAAVCDGVQNQS
mmetsp:Transcript_61103/g.126141  ORF Transcript_61103/g.126141 Transcript_61103/m.126141 type:complete len:233 (-) Transcript_61103:960-1658(-)